MAKLLIATRFPNSVKTIAKTFKESRINEAQTKYLWFTEKDFSVEAESTSRTNNYLLHNNKPWTVLQFDPGKIERANAKAPAEVTMQELIETVIESNPFRISDGSIKFIATEDTKEALNNVINKQHIANNKTKVTPTINNNTISDVVLNHERVSLQPTLVPDINDEDISGMDDILGAVKESNTKQKEELAEAARAVLEE